MSTFQKSSITAESARKVIAAAEAKAAEISTPMCIAVVDEGGSLKGFSRMDGAVLLAVQIAQDKAYTAVAYGIPTDQFYDFIKNDPPLVAGLPGAVDRLIIFGGGYPINVDGQVVGGLGVSGGHYTQDMEVAQAGLKALD